MSAYDTNGMMMFGLIWMMSYEVPRGSEGSSCAKAASTASSAWFMFEPQGKSTKISAAPREVVELTFTAPGTARATRSSGSVAEAGTGLVPVEISLPPGSFLPGEMAEAAIITRELKGYVVPHEAILVDDSGAPYVVQAIDEVAHKVPVRILDAEGDRDVIEGKLDAHAPLVLAGNHQPDDGMRIRLAGPPKAAGGR